jgi:hypothetical protein
MNEGPARRWNNYDISSDGHVVEECVTGPGQERRVTWYDLRDGSVIGRSGSPTGVRRTDEPSLT